MADPLSIAASVAGLVSLTGSVFGLLCKLSLQQKDFNREITELQSATRELSVLLHDLSLLATSLQTEPTFDGSFRLDHVDSCERTLHDVKTKLEKICPANPPTGRTAKIIKSTRNRLKWPYSSREFEKLLADLARHKETISLALSVDSMSALLQTLSKQRDISKGVKYIRDTVNEIKTRIFVDEHREKVLDFFLPVNPQINFETSIRLRHPMTGLWLTEEQAFKNWIYSPNAKLWMSGIPGAGKTVIAGSAIEEVLMVASSGTAIGVCFFFCDYKNPKSLDPVNILSSFASQLARQNDRAYAMLEQYYAELHPGQNLPKLNKLVGIGDLVVKMADLFDRVLVVVDGLDECGSDSPVADELADMARKSQVVSMALLSRDEMHIREALGDMFEHIDIAARGSDVRRYVREELEDRIKRRQLRLRSQELKEDMINTLIGKAGGMFRWVSCQLDYLCELPLDKDRREALTKLPPTLNAIYERVLSRHSHPSAVHIVRTTLRIVAAVGPSITIPALCEAVSVPEHAACLQEDNTVLEEDIIRYCSSLLRVSPDNQHLEFAHFTVPEFLQSTSLLGTSLGGYHLGTDTVMTVVELCLRVLLLDDFRLDILSDSSPEVVIATAKTICKEHPFYDFAAWEWPFLSEGFLRDVSVQNDSPSSGEDTNVSLRALGNALKLFTFPGKSNFRLWAVTFCERYITTSPLDYYEGITRSIPPILDGTFTPLHMACVLTLPSIVARLAAGSKSHLSCERQFLADCAIYGLSALEYEGYHDVLRSNMRHVSREIQTDMIVVMASLGYIELPMRVPWTILARDKRDFRTGRVPDPTDLVLRLLEGGFSCDLAVINGLEAAIAHFCNTQKVDGDGLAHRLRIIRQKINPRGFTESEMDGINNLLTHMIQSSISGSYTMDYRHPKELTDNTFRQFLYEAAHSGNISALKVYSMDKRYKSRTWCLTGYTPLLHVAMLNSCFDTFEYLASTGWDDSVLDERRGTVWHMLASGIHREWFELLRDISADPESRQADVNCDMQTPIRIAVQNANYDLARQLLELCKSRECFVGSPSVYEMALRGGSGATELIKAIFLHGVLRDKDQLPVYQIPLDSDPVAVMQLLSLWPGCTDQRYKDRLPIESLLERLAVYDGGTLDRDLLIELLPTSRRLQLDVFRFFCSEILSYSDIPYASDDFPNLLGTAIEVMADLPGVPSPLSSLVRAFLTWIGTGTCYPGMAQLDTTMSGILDRSIHRTSDGGLCELLHASVFFGWEALSRKVLALGINLHKCVQDRSILEVASLPESLCSGTTFGELMRSTHATRTSDINTQYDPRLVFLLAEGRDNTAKLEHLLKQRADSNPQRPISEQQVLIHHLHHGSKETTQLLLQYGGRPQSDLAGFDIACALVWWNLTQELEQFREQHPETEWSKEVPPSLYLGDGDRSIRDIRDDCGADWRLTHLAAFRGSFECLAYLLDEGLVDNINAATSAGYTCAHLIASSAAPRTVLCTNYLQSAGCNFNALTRYQQSPLDIAIEKGSDLDTVEALASMDVEVSDPGCFISLALDDSLEVIECISAVRQGDKSEKDWMLYTLRNAINHGRVLHCEKLRSLGCPLDRPLPTCRSYTPLLYALDFEKYATVKWLLDNGGVAWGTPCQRVGLGETPVSLAAARPIFNDLLERLLRTLRDSWRIWLLERASPVIAAITSLNLDGLRIILEFISSQSTRDDCIQQQVHPTQLSYAKVEDSAETIADIPSVSKILNAPADNMALHIAAYKDSPPLMALLIEYGAQIDARDATGRMPIYVAAERRSLEAVRFLLVRGANATSPSPNLESLLYVAADLDDLALLKLVAPHCPSDRAGPITAGLLSPLSRCRSEECLQLLLAEGFSLGDVDALGLSPIHFLLGRKALQPFIIQSNLLATHGLDRTRVELEELPDDIVGGIIEIIPELVRTLGKETTLAMFPSRPNRGQSALCAAADFGNVDCCRELVSIGADLDFDGHRCGSALALAILYAQFEVLKYLVRAGAGLVYYSRRESCWKNAFAYAHRHPSIYRWLLVDRYTEQRCIAFC